MFVSPYLRIPPRTLRDACQEIGRDAGGKACLDCPLADICKKEMQRKVRKA